MDSVSDMLTIIRNGYRASKNEVTFPFSKLKKTLAEKLMRLGYLDSVKEAEKDSKKIIVVTLKYSGGVPEIEGLRRVSKPGLRVYKNKYDIPYVYGGLGSAILSTNQGLLTDKEARKKKIGGEIILEVW